MDIFGNVKKYHGGAGDPLRTKNGHLITSVRQHGDQIQKPSAYREGTRQFELARQIDEARMRKQMKEDLEKEKDRLEDEKIKREVEDLKRKYEEEQRREQNNKLLQLPKLANNQSGIQNQQQMQQPKLSARNNHVNTNGAALPQWRHKTPPHIRRMRKAKELRNAKLKPSPEKIQPFGLRDENQESPYKSQNHYPSQPIQHPPQPIQHPSQPIQPIHHLSQPIHQQHVPQIQQQSFNSYSQQHITQPPPQMVQQSSLIPTDDYLNKHNFKSQHNQIRNETNPSFSLIKEMENMRLEYQKQTEQLEDELRKHNIEIDRLHIEIQENKKRDSERIDELYEDVLYFEDEVKHWKAEAHYWQEETKKMSKKVKESRTLKLPKINITNQEKITEITDPENHELKCESSFVSCKIQLHKDIKDFRDLIKTSLITKTEIIEIEKCPSLSLSKREPFEEDIHSKSTIAQILQQAVIDVEKNTL